jgi:hypothetical protein
MCLGLNCVLASIVRVLSLIVDPQDAHDLFSMRVICFDFCGVFCLFASLVSRLSLAHSHGCALLHSTGDER